MMEALLEFAKITVPALLVLYAAYLLTRTVLKGLVEKIYLEKKENTKRKTLFLRLRAYERMCLFVERSALPRLVTRDIEAKDARSLHYFLLRTIREEFDHNLPQQIYLSQRVWMLLRAYVEQSITLLNDCMASVPDGTSRHDFAKVVIERFLKQEKNLAEECLDALKEEARKVME